MFACETRPLLQGARLTAWELADAGVPVTVLPGWRGRLAAGPRDVDAVLVGCDRVAANGDVANKIGTFSLAVAARSRASRSTSRGRARRSTRPRRPETRSRSSSEPPTRLRSHPGRGVWKNPAFDVTPASLITGIITDAGVLRAPYGPAIAAALS